MCWGMTTQDKRVPLETPQSTLCHGGLALQVCAVDRLGTPLQPHVTRLRNKDSASEGPASPPHPRHSELPFPGLSCLGAPETTSS